MSDQLRDNPDAPARTEVMLCLIQAGLITKECEVSSASNSSVRRSRRAARLDDVAGLVQR